MIAEFYPDFNHFCMAFFRRSGKLRANTERNGTYDLG